MDRKCVRKLLIGMMVLIILTFVEVQTDGHPDILPDPVPIPFVHITKREKLPFLFDACLQHETKVCSQSLKSSKEYFQCKVKSYQECFMKPVYYKQPVYFKIQSIQYECKMKERKPQLQALCIRHYYNRWKVESHIW